MCGEGYIDLKTLGKLLGLSPRTLRTCVHDAADPVPAYRVGGKLLFRWSEVEAWVARRRVIAESLDDMIGKFARHFEREGNAWR